ncbi:hypothetical protein ACAG39_12265 [Caldicellulosiruptoraceae bacterium PP1]
MKVYYTDYFVEKVNELSSDIKKILKQKLSLMVENPKHPSLRSKKIKGSDNIFEASITMEIRMTWQYYKDGILLRNIGEHDKTLKNP